MKQDKRAQSSPTKEGSITFSINDDEPSSIKKPQESKGALADLEGSPKSTSPKSGSPKSGSPKSGSPKSGSPKSTSPNSASPRASKDVKGSKNDREKDSDDQSSQNDKRRNAKDKSGNQVSIAESASSVEETVDPDEPFVPRPYTFRSRYRAKQMNRVPTQCPPFYLQLDHTLAVIWMLFDEQVTEPLGIVQLQWALTFLKGVSTRTGERPRDVALCIEVIESLLLERYADMAEDVAAIEQHEKEELQKKRPVTLVATVPSKKSICESESCFARLSLEADRTMGVEEEEEERTKQVPFSINYNDMNDRAIAHVKELSTKGSRSSTLGSMMDFDLPEEQTLHFLRQWRRDQLSKLQEEVKKLRAIEKYLGTAETNFDVSERDLARAASSVANARKSRFRD